MSASAKYADVSLNPRVRVAMRALVESGHYPETPDAFEWLWRDAAYCVAEFDRTHLTMSVILALTDAGLHDVEDAAEQRCLGCDADRVVLALADGPIDLFTPSRMS
jgi:hypothetical protein